MEQHPAPKPEANKMLMRISSIMAAIGSATLAVMMLLSVADVIGRKFFLHPIQGTAELVGILLVIASGTGLGYAALTRSHVRISIVIDRLSSRGRAAVDVISYLICVVASGIISWQSSLRMYEYIFRELGGRTAILAMPIWPFMLVMVIGFVWLTVIFVILLISSVKEVLKR
jgi:TRAP-type transport system small permease protein